MFLPGEVVTLAVALAGNVHPPARRRQGAILGRIGAQFVEQEGQRRSGAVVNFGILAMEGQPALAILAIGLHQALDERLERALVLRRA